MIAKAWQAHGDSYWKDVQTGCWEVALVPISVREEAGGPW